MTTTFESAQIGDRVWCMWGGWGEIVNIRDGEEYPLIVEFEDEEKESYRYDGKVHKHDINQTIFWDEVKIEAPKKPLPDLER